MPPLIWWDMRRVVARDSTPFQNRFSLPLDTVSRGGGQPGSGQVKYDIKWGEMAAGTIMSLIPTMCLFAFAQKYMIEGLTAGAVKG